MLGKNSSASIGTVHAHIFISWSHHSELSVVIVFWEFCQSYAHVYSLHIKTVPGSMFDHKAHCMGWHECHNGYIIVEITQIHHYISWPLYLSVLTLRLWHNSLNIMYSPAIEDKFVLACQRMIWGTLHGVAWVLCMCKYNNNFMIRILLSFLSLYLFPTLIWSAHFSILLPSLSP